MTGKEHTHASVAGGRKDLEHLPRDLITILHLTQNSNLHVVHEQRDASWIARFCQRLRYVDSIGALHVCLGRVTGWPRTCRSKPESADPRARDPKPDRA